jgi:acyl phosphate:glycerol-3-phosphate acyltransferase
MTIIILLLSGVAGYLMGSIPSAYLVGQLKGVDMRQVGDCRIGASFAVRTLGLSLGVVVGLMDLLKGVFTVIVLQAMGLTQEAILFGGLLAVVGHNWSIFMGFKGGLGAMTMYGVLVVLAPWQLIIALTASVVCYLIIRRTTFSTFFALAFLSLLLWAGGVSLISLPMSPTQTISPLLVIFPLLLFIPMYLKPRISRCAQ